MTVKELIEELQGFNANFVVAFDKGYDYFPLLNKVSTCKEHGIVILTPGRHNTYHYKDLRNEMDKR